MPRARGSLGVSMGPTNSHHSLQGDVLILCAPFSRGGGRGGGGGGALSLFLFPLQTTPISSSHLSGIYIYIYIYIYILGPWATPERFCRSGFVCGSVCPPRAQRPLLRPSWHALSLTFSLSDSLRLRLHSRGGKPPLPPPSHSIFTNSETL